MTPREPDGHDHHDEHHAAARVALGGDGRRWCCWRFPSVVIGFMTIEPMLFGDFFKDAIFVDDDKHPAMKELAEAFHGPLADGLARPDRRAVLAGAGRRGGWPGTCT